MNILYNSMDDFDINSIFTELSSVLSTEPLADLPEVPVDEERSGSLQLSYCVIA